MTPAVENFKNGWITMTATFAISMITIFFASKLGAIDTDKRETEQEKKEFKIELDARFEKKADKTWVVEQVTTVEAKSAITDVWVKDMLNKIYQQNVDNTKRIDDFIKASK